MLGIRGDAATRRASTGCSMTVDKALLPSDGWTNFRAYKTWHWKRRRKRPIRAREVRVTSVTGFIHTWGLPGPGGGRALWTAPGQWANLPRHEALGEHA